MAENGNDQCQNNDFSLTEGCKVGIGKKRYEILVSRRMYHVSRKKALEYIPRPFYLHDTCVRFGSYVVIPTICPFHFNC